MSSSHTYAVLDVSREAFDEIQEGLEKAGYQDQFVTDSKGRLTLVMTGIGLITSSPIKNMGNPGVFDGSRFNLDE